ncbi:MAG: hypothetical protein HYY50_01145 [Candidatus Kerfeldbacteria bacterium]|nr:hypothetical protein [Candidatus Kerfeldbacteria bacterium]
MATAKRNAGRRPVRTKSKAPLAQLQAIAPHRYRPYHVGGEVTFLLTTAVIGLIFLLLPLPVLIRLLGSVLLLLVLPVTVLRDAWPALKLEHLGWQPPERPRQPAFFGAAVIIMACLPLILFLSVKQPDQYVAVAPQLPWSSWFLGQGAVAIIILAQAAFFTGLLLFRLTHLLKPWAAVLLVGLILAAGQLAVPGSIRYFAAPLTVLLAWMAWQTRSFVPVAATQILLTVIFDLIVRFT